MSITYDADARAQSRNPATYWWRQPKNDKHSSVFTSVEYLDEVQQSRRDGMLRGLRRYSNRSTPSFGAGDYSAATDGGARIRMNVTKACIDTAVAHMATQKSRPMYLTKAGDYKQRKRAEALGKFMLGQFLSLDRYKKGRQIFRDGAIFGVGVEKFWSNEGKIHSERVFPDELIFDEEEAHRGQPRQLFQHKLFHREALEHLFPEAKKEIAIAPRIRDDIGTFMGITEPVSVIEAWHLPSGKDAKDGRHVICIGNKTLVDEEWTRESFPFAIFNWSDPVVGWFGIGLAEELAPIQLEINYIAQKIQRLMTLATSFVWKEKGSGVGRIMNKDMAQYEYTGKPPIFQTVASVSAEYFGHLDRLYQRAFELVGISMMAASSARPEGIESGEALRVFNDIGSKRWQHVAQRWEDFHLEAAKRIYEEAKDLADSGTSLKTLCAQDKDVEEIDFKQAYIEEDQYVLQPWPVNLLPDTPTGKVEAMGKLAQAAPAMAPYLPSLLTGVPDVEHVVERMEAPRKLADKMVGQILDSGKFEAPSPAMDLDLTRMIATQELLRALTDNAPEDRVSLLRRFIARVDDLIQARDTVERATAGPMAGGGASPTLSGPPPIPPDVPPPAPEAPAAGMGPEPTLPTVQ